MEKKKKLKRYVVFITWYPNYSDIYDDAIDIWVHDKKEVKRVLNSYYNTNLLKTAASIKIYYRPISTIWWRLTDKAPNEPVVDHL
jgi:hypothetical protein